MPSLAACQCLFEFSRIYDNSKCLYKNIWKRIECTTYSCSSFRLWDFACLSLEISVQLFAAVFSHFCCPVFFILSLLLLCSFTCDLQVLVLMLPRYLQCWRFSSGFFFLDVHCVSKLSLGLNFHVSSSTYLSYCSCVWVTPLPILRIDPSSL